MSWEIREGDALTRLREMPDESVHCVVTSPPYWGLRDYGVSGQLGLERTPEEYTAALVGVFAEVRRVLRSDGTLWLNLGDSYAASGMGGNPEESAFRKQATNAGSLIPGRKAPAGLKPKDLCGIPWRVFFALQQPYYQGTIRNEIDRVWLAAMLDAEGCLFIHKRKAGQSNGQGYHRKNDNYGPGLEIANTSLAVVERIMALVGKGSICTQGPEENGRRRQTLYRWNLRTTESREFVRELYPYLVAKQHQARLLYGCPSFGPQAEAAHEALKGLHRGRETTVDFPAPPTLYGPGWYLRSDVIWAKKNCMPESVTDRPTKAHEYVGLFAKSERYFYDADAVAEPIADSQVGRVRADVVGGASHVERGQHSKGGTYRGSSFTRGKTGVNGDGRNQPDDERADPIGVSGTRNRRSVWSIATTPYPEAHFATFPPELPELCIKAGTSEKGCCPECGAPWERVVERAFDEKAAAEIRLRRGVKHSAQRNDAENHNLSGKELARLTTRTDLGWAPTCEHGTEPVPCTVLDPFAGAGTTGLVATRLGRNFVGIEINPTYAEMARRRIDADCPLFNRDSA